MYCELMLGEPSVKEFSDWKPGSPVGCMFVTVCAVIEIQGGGGGVFLQHYLSEDKEEIRREREHVCVHACV